MKNMSDKTLFAILKDCQNVKSEQYERVADYDNLKRMHWWNGGVVFDPDYVVESYKGLDNHWYPITIKDIEHGTILKRTDEYDILTGDTRTTVYLLNDRKYKVEKHNGYYTNAEVI